MFGAKKRWLYASEIIIGLVVVAAYYFSTYRTTWEEDLKVGIRSRNQGLFSVAESHFKSALKKAEKKPFDPISVAVCHYSLAQLYVEQGRFPESEVHYKEAEGILEKILGPKNPEVAKIWKEMAILYQKKGDKEESHKWETQAEEILSKNKKPIR